MPTAILRPLHELAIQRQPDDVTCGPTCLHAVYRHFGDELPLAQLVREVELLEEGGTLAPFLAIHALRRGYRATLYTYNLHLFDPTWFALAPAEVQRRLGAQADAKHGRKLRRATRAYDRYLSLGGELRLADLSAELLREPLVRGLPVITGLSATWLYRSIREHGPGCEDDDVRGEPVGHFVVLCGCDDGAGTVRVADPHPSTAFADRPVYDVPLPRLLSAILLGPLTYDGNLLILEPPAAR